MSMSYVYCYSYLLIHRHHEFSMSFSLPLVSSKLMVMDVASDSNVVWSYCRTVVPKKTIRHL